ncbi:MAG TPA: hypothetical protein PL182_12380, partial [Pseudobdellovibrionaceae bacterium]|nr:hypothetical protein [Pseudobdellovibrionaceae bacterium]
MKTHIARREFLRQMSRGFGVYALHSTLLDGLMGQILNAAFAQTTNGTLPDPGVFYVHMSMPGGPPRWFVDLPLTPDGQTVANFKAGGFGTVLTKTGGIAGVAYESRKITAAGVSYWMPPVWGMNLKAHNFTNVFTNTLIMRGVDMEINNHSLSNQRQVSPVIGGFSLTGMVADATGCPLPSILDGGTPATQAFRSKKGLAGSTLSYPAQANETATNNPVALTLAPFKEFRTGRPAHGPANTQMGEQVLKQFEIYAKGHGLTESAMTKMYDSALSLIDQNVISMGNQWATTVAKYRAIISEAIHPAKGSLPGLFDS